MPPGNNRRVIISRRASRREIMSSEGRMARKHWLEGIVHSSLAGKNVRGFRSLGKAGGKETAVRGTESRGLLFLSRQALPEGTEPDHFLPNLVKNIAFRKVLSTILKKPKANGLVTRTMWSMSLSYFLETAKHVVSTNQIVILQLGKNRRERNM